MEAVLNIDRALGVVRELFLRVLEVAEVFWVNAQVHVPIPAGLEPVLVPLFVRSWFDEEFHLHLLELTGAEDEVARRNFVTERFADLTDAKRWLLTRTALHVGEVDEDSLSGFRTQVVHARFVFDRTKLSAQQPVEFTRLSPLSLGSTVGARDVGETIFRLAILARFKFFFELVGTKALVTRQTLRQWVNECVDVTRGHPHRRR